MSTDASSDSVAGGLPGALVRSLRARIGEELAAGGDAMESRLALGRALAAQGRDAEAVRELESLVARSDLDERRRATAAAFLAGALVRSGRGDDGHRAATAVLRSSAADVEALVLARSALRGLEFFACRFEHAVEQARRIVELAAQSGPIARAEARLDLGGMLMHADAFDEAQTWLALDDDAPSWAREEAVELRGYLHLFHGDFGEVLRLVDLPDATTGDVDRSDVSRVVRPGMRAHALIHLDRIEQAARELATSSHVGSPPMNLIASALIAEARGDVAAAATEAERGMGRASEQRFAPQLRMWALEIVRLARAGGALGTATWAADRMEATAAVTNVASVRAVAVAARGMVERDPERLAHAVDVLRAGPRRVTHAKAAEALGELEAEQGRVPEAIDSLRAALAVWQRVGAVRDARRVAQALAGLGIRTRSAPRSHERFGWEALSSTEATVAALLAEGLTNTQIAERLVISRRTAESHVAHVLAKLEVPTRAAAARVVVERRERHGR